MLDNANYVEMKDKREEFEVWLIHMDDQLEVFLNSFDEPIKSQLDFSPGSLDVIEGWLLDNFKTYQELQEVKYKKLVDLLARYIGETFRKNIKGKWDMNLTDPNYVFYGMPIIMDGEKKETITCPHYLPTSAIDRKSGNFLRTILNNY